MHGIYSCVRKIAFLRTPLKIFYTVKALPKFLCSRNFHFFNENLNSGRYSKSCGKAITRLHIFLRQQIFFTCSFLLSESMSTKQDEFESIMLEENCENIAITATWWDETHNQNFNMIGYTLY